MATGSETEHVTGMPQLDFSTFGSQIFWFLLALGGLYFMLSRIAIPRIAETLATRQEAIARDLEQAAELRDRAAEAEAAYEKALADARSQAQEIAAETRAEIRKELDAAMAKADAEIAAKSAESEGRIAEIREAAIDNVREVATDTAEALVDKLLPGAGDADAVKTAVTARMKG
jgi:F-type H+-transporting ATPase subunit b